MRFLPAWIAVAVLLGTGIVHGLWTDRWGASAEVHEASRRLALVPSVLGDWEGTDNPVDSRDLALAGGTGCLSRKYTHRQTGEAITMLVLSGRPGPISVHTPDVCYRGLGYEPTEVAAKWSPASARGAEFWTARFRKDEPARSSYLRICWTWSSGGEWRAVEQPRLAFAGQPVLFKLYLIRQMADGDETLETDPCATFLTELLPRLASVPSGQLERPSADGIGSP